MDPNKVPLLLLPAVEEEREREREIPLIYMKPISGLTDFQALSAFDTTLARTRKVSFSPEGFYSALRLA